MLASPSGAIGKPLLEFLQGLEAMRDFILFDLFHLGKCLALVLEDRIPAYARLTLSVRK